MTTDRKPQTSLAFGRREGYYSPPLLDPKPNPHTSKPMSAAACAQNTVGGIASDSNSTHASNVKGRTGYASGMEGKWPR